jgi:low affinity Fe/Cu permease
MFDRLTRAAARAAGSPLAFILAAALILAWLAAGPFVGFSNTLYQLVINTATTIVTFLMVFLVQADANRGFAAQSAKLDELIRASTSRNELIGIEELSSAEIELIRKQILNARSQPAPQAQSRASPP